MPRLAGENNITSGMIGGVESFDVPAIGVKKLCPKPYSGSTFCQCRFICFGRCCQWW